MSAMICRRSMFAALRRVDVRAGRSRTACNDSRWRTWTCTDTSGRAAVFEESSGSCCGMCRGDRNDARRSIASRRVEAASALRFTRRVLRCRRRGDAFNARQTCCCRSGACAGGGNAVVVKRIPRVASGGGAGEALSRAGLPRACSMWSSETGAAQHLAKHQQIDVLTSPAARRRDALARGEKIHRGARLNARTWCDTAEDRLGREIIAFISQTCRSAATISSDVALRSTWGSVEDGSVNGH